MPSAVWTYKLPPSCISCDNLQGVSVLYDIYPLKMSTGNSPLVTRYLEYWGRFLKQLCERDLEQAWRENDSATWTRTRMWPVPQAVVPQILDPIFKYHWLGITLPIVTILGLKAVALPGDVGPILDWFHVRCANFRKSDFMEIKSWEQRCSAWLICSDM